MRVKGADCVRRLIDVVGYGGECEEILNVRGGCEEEGVECGVWVGGDM